MEDKTIRELIEESHQIALDHGWWEAGDRPILEQLMLMVTELAEAAEEIRNGHRVGDTYYNPERPVTDDNDCVLLKPEGFLAELADVYIRIGDTIGHYGLIDNFLTVLSEKTRYNMYREYRHGNKQA